MLNKRGNSVLFHLFILIQLTSASISGRSCGDNLAQNYIDTLKAVPGGVNNFVPSAYFYGGATKFVSSTGEKEIDHSFLCVDGATSYNGKIVLYDNGKHGDDIANDGVYSRDCVHFCKDHVNFSDYFGFAMEYEIESAKLIVVKRTLMGSVPVKKLNTKLTADATVLATSHALFFADVNKVYMPKWPMESSPNSFSAPSGKSFPISALLETFGDVFDHVTVTPYESSKGAIEGAGIWKWQVWDLAGGPSPRWSIGDIDFCSIALSGVPVYRLIGAINTGDIVDEISGQWHELIHGVSGFEYHNNLESARTGDGMHVPGSCTDDRSYLQGPVWDWVDGFPYGIPASNPNNDNGVRLVANDDCGTCADGDLSKCCSFRYEDIPSTKGEMMLYPELIKMSPLTLYIAGMILAEDISENEKVYYCMGSDTDGGCGSSDSQPPCTIVVDDSDRSKITSDYVTRFTFDDLVNANGGPRNPARKNDVIRHAAIHIGQRIPSEAELTFYTLLWRYHEVESEPWERTPNPWGSRPPIDTWRFTTSGHSTLHSRLHGIDCGEKNLQVPSCSENLNVCNDSPCGNGALCIPLDGQPLCICRDGYVGDGITCVLPSKTISYSRLPTAYELTDDAIHCFVKDHVWPRFIDESSLPAYPGGEAPYSATSCGSKVCGIGWTCKNNECIAPTGTSMCEGHGFTREQCEAIGCCEYTNGKCSSQEAYSESECPPLPSDEDKWKCEDTSTCCYWPCDRLTLDHDGAQIGQVGNCGKDCTIGIDADINGVVHPELYLWPDTYITRHEQYGYGDGPLKVDGDNKNMFYRCYDACFGTRLEIVSGLSELTKPMCLVPTYLGSGAKITISACKGWNSQKWLINSKGKLQNAKTPTLCITAVWKNLVMMECDDNDQRQQFAYNIFDGNIISFKSALNSITIKDSQAKMLPREVASRRQIWEIRPELYGEILSYNDEFQIVSKASSLQNQMLCAVGNYLGIGAKIILKECKPFSFMQWKIDQEGKLHSAKKPGLCLEFMGQRLLLSKCVEKKKNQLWVHNVMNNKLNPARNGLKSVMIEGEEAFKGQRLKLLSDQDVSSNDLGAWKLQKA